MLPFNIIYAVDDPETQLNLFNYLLTSCIDEHAPLSKFKISRPPAPWMHDNEVTNIIRKRINHLIQ